jgi:proteic killer suppression protein
MPDEISKEWPSGLSKQLKTGYALSARRMRRFMEERPMSQPPRPERRQGRQIAISINDQWRICFRFQDGDTYDVEAKRGYQAQIEKIKPLRAA